MPGPQASQKVASEVEGAPRCMSCNLQWHEQRIYLRELVRTLKAVGANMPGTQASQEVTSDVEERPAMHVVQFALAEQRIYMRRS